MVLLLLSLSLSFADVQLPQPGQLPSDQELETKTFVELTLYRNQIFARKGRPFTTPWVNAFFQKQPWYKPNKNFSFKSITKKEQSIVNTISRIEVTRTPADLRLRRNTVFARHGRIFKSKDLREHFAKQPWYKEDPTFTLDRLSERDEIEIALIQKFEKKANAVRGVADWKPGRSIDVSVLENTPSIELGQFALRFFKETQLKSTAPTDENFCEGASIMFEGFCDSMAKGKRSLRSLAKTDRATFKKLEQAMAYAVVTSVHHEWRDCEGECQNDACIQKCEQEIRERDAADERKQNKAIARLRKGEHDHGKVLMKAFMNSVLSSMA